MTGRPIRGARIQKYKTLKTLVSSRMSDEDMPPGETIRTNNLADDEMTISRFLLSLSVILPPRLGHCDDGAEGADEPERARELHLLVKHGREGHHPSMFLSKMANALPLNRVSNARGDGSGARRPTARRWGVRVVVPAKYPAPTHPTMNGAAAASVPAPRTSWPATPRAASVMSVAAVKSPSARNAGFIGGLPTPGVDEEGGFGAGVSTPGEDAPVSSPSGAAATRSEGREVAGAAGAKREEVDAHASDASGGGARGVAREARARTARGQRWRRSSSRAF